MLRDDFIDDFDNVNNPDNVDGQRPVRGRAEEGIVPDLQNSPRRRHSLDLEEDYDDLYGGLKPGDDFVDFEEELEGTPGHSLERF